MAVWEKHSVEGNALSKKERGPEEGRLTECLGVTFLGMG